MVFFLVTVAGSFQVRYDDPTVWHGSPPRIPSELHPRFHRTREVWHFDESVRACRIWRESKDVELDSDLDHLMSYVNAAIMVEEEESSSIRIQLDFRPYIYDLNEKLISPLLDHGN